MVLRAEAPDTSAWGQWPIAIAVGVAVVSLGPRLALALVVPTLWPSAQMHYGMFSVPAIKRSSPLAVALSWAHPAAPAVVIYALAIRLRTWLDLGRT